MQGKPQLKSQQLLRRMVTASEPSRPLFLAHHLPWTLFAYTN
jgi:hypothetical protein